MSCREEPEKLLACVPDPELQNTTSQFIYHTHKAMPLSPSTGLLNLKTWLLPRMMREPVVSFVGWSIRAPFTYVVLSWLGMMVTMPGEGEGGRGRSHFSTERHLLKLTHFIFKATVVLHNKLPTQLNIPISATPTSHAHSYEYI